MAAGPVAVQAGKIKRQYTRSSTVTNRVLINVLVPMVATEALVDEEEEVDGEGLEQRVEILAAMAGPASHLPPWQVKMALAVTPVTPVGRVLATQTPEGLVREARMQVAVAQEEALVEHQEAKVNQVYQAAIGEQRPWRSRRTSRPMVSDDYLDIY
jgi:hypothetical protein